MISFGNASRGSFKRQIILTYVVGFFFLLVAFVAYMVKFESGLLYSESNENTAFLARSLAVNSRSWVLANDVEGLQEVVNSVRDYPGLRFAMIVSPAGRVLAHTDAGKIGLFLEDVQSRSLIGAPPAIRVLRDETSFVDIAVPIMAGERHVGWARIGRERTFVNATLNSMILHNVLFILLATTLALLAAFLIARRLGYRIGSLVQVTETVQAGNFDERANIAGRADEITLLADRFNRMLDALAQNQKELRSASQYTRSLIEASLDPLVTISPEGKITDANKAAEAVTGWDRLELIGTDFSDHFTEPDKARKAYQQALLKGAVSNFPLALRSRDGHVTDVLYNASDYRDEAGKALGVFAAARDITELKRTLTELRELKEDLEIRVAERTAQLEDANKELESFSYSVSHDLRTPLRAIDGFSHILLDDYIDKLDDEGRRLLNVVRDNTSRMGQLIDDILKFSRAGRLEITFAEIDMDGLAHTVAADLQASVADGKLQLEIEPLPPANGDSAMMRQVFVNLLSNAIKFSRNKAPAIIRVGGSIAGNEAIYYVKDNGAGFDMQYVDKLFGVFQRLHGVTEFEGTGIGLAIVKRIITRHGGRVWAEGRVGEGATIYFALPNQEKDHG